MKHSECEYCGVHLYEVGRENRVRAGRRHCSVLAVWPLSSRKNYGYALGRLTVHFEARQCRFRTNLKGNYFDLSSIKHLWCCMGVKLGL
jgi:hypothetical protein